METVIVSSKYRIVVPRSARQALGVHVYQRLQVLTFGDRIELIPLKAMPEMRGAFEGIDTTVDRESAHP